MLRLSRFVLTAVVVLAALGACAGMPAGHDVPAEEIPREDDAPDSDTPDTEAEYREPATPEGGDEETEYGSADDVAESDEADTGDESVDETVTDDDTDVAAVSGDTVEQDPSAGIEQTAVPALETLSYDDEAMTQSMRRERARRLAAQRLAEMSLDEQIGQMLMPSYIFDGRSRPVRSVTDRIRTELGDVRPGGIILFGQNIGDAEQTRQFTSALQGLSDTPLFIATDQEGGIVSRLTQNAGMNATRFPSAQAIGRTGDSEYAYRVGRAIAMEMRALGINMNLAPVADILTNPGNTVIGSRAFGSDPQLVSDMVVQMIIGLQDEHVVSVVKHFPGHGDSFEDSHLERVVLSHDRERLQQVELLPFRSAIEAGVDGIMSAHIDLPNVFGEGVPVTLSQAALEGLLRDEMGFEGLIVTDSLVMEAVTQRFSPAELAVAAVVAGSDILLQPGSAVVARNAILDAVADGRIAAERIARSAQRVLEAKYFHGVFEAERWLPEDQSALGSPSHRALVEEIRAAAP